MDIDRADATLMGVTRTLADRLRVAPGGVLLASFWAYVAMAVGLLLAVDAVLAPGGAPMWAFGAVTGAWLGWKRGGIAERVATTLDDPRSMTDQDRHAASLAGMVAQRRAGTLSMGVGVAAFAVGFALLGEPLFAQLCVGITVVLWGRCALSYLSCVPPWGVARGATPHAGR